MVIEGRENDGQHEDKPQNVDALPGGHPTHIFEVPIWNIKNNDDGNRKTSSLPQDVLSMNTRSVSSIPPEQIEGMIFLVRRLRVMLSTNLAQLYGVESRILVQTVKRNIARFPTDFMFQLTRHEYESLRSQIVILEKGRGKHIKYLPYVFTEQGVAMLSSVLNSPRAVRVNIEIMRTFVRLRRVLSSNSAISKKLAELAGKVAYHDDSIRSLVAAIRRLASEPPPEPKRRPIGFRPDGE